MAQQHSIQTSGDNIVSPQSTSGITPAARSSKQSAGTPEWLTVVLVLAFIFFVLPALTPLLFKLFLLTH